MGQIAQLGQKFQCVGCGERYNDKRYANMHKKHFASGAGYSGGKDHSQFRKVSV